MNIWILNHYAGPPNTTPATRTVDISRELMRMGHHVTVFACSFNHYTLEEEQLEPYQMVRLARVDGVPFVWIRSVPYEGNGVRRLLNMVVYAMLSLLVGIFLRNRPQLIIGVTVHPFAPVAGYILSRLRRARFWLDITDIWPDSLIDLGYLRADSLPARLFRMLELFSLRKAERVVSVLPNIDQYVRDKGLPNKPTTWISNGIHARRVAKMRFEEVSRDREELVVMWAGGFAPAHSLDTVVDAAVIVTTSCPRPIRFVLIGDGPERERVQTRVRELGLTNVELLGFLPKQELYHRLSQADAFLCTGRDLPVYRYGVSYNKIFDYLLVGRPIIFALNSCNDPVTQADAGITAPPEDPQALASAIIQLSEMPVKVRQEMGRRGRELVTEQYEYSVLAARLAANF